MRQNIKMPAADLLEEEIFMALQHGSWPGRLIMPCGRPNRTGKRK
jgi:hypothetical protein